MDQSEDPEGLLTLLEGREVGSHSLRVGRVYRPRAREKECRYFDLKLEVSDRELGTIVSGLFNAGRKSINVSSYFDIDFEPRLRLKGGVTLDLRDEGVDRELFRVLSTLVQPGGKIIVAVASMQDPLLHASTFKGLDEGVPAEATYLGGLLFASGCGSEYKSWLIREGGREGSPALQGNKAPSRKMHLEHRRATAARLSQYVKVGKGEYLELARSILREIKEGDFPKWVE